MRKFRSYVKCDKCKIKYTTIKHRKKKPARCKECGSIQLRVLSAWEVY